MKNIAVIYKSNYGSTKKYAAWISEEINADLFEKSQINPADLLKYDYIIFGGALYASGIIGIDLVVNNPVKNLIVFTVGLANPATTDYEKILKENIPFELREKTKVFHFRGAIDYKKMILPLIEYINKL